MDTKIPKLVYDFPKPLAVFINLIHEVLRCYWSMCIHISNFSTPRKSDGFGKSRTILVFCYPGMGELHLQGFGGVDFFSNLNVGGCIFYENVPIETFNISFESTHNKQQYGTKITAQEVRVGENYDD